MKKLIKLLSIVFLLFVLTKANAQKFPDIGELQKQGFAKTLDKKLGIIGWFESIPGTNYFASGFDKARIDEEPGIDVASFRYQVNKESRVNIMGFRNHAYKKKESDLSNLRCRMMNTIIEGFEFLNKELRGVSKDLIITTEEFHALFFKRYSLEELEKGISFENDNCFGIVWVDNKGRLHIYITIETTIQIKKINY